MISFKLTSQLKKSLLELEDATLQAYKLILSLTVEESTAIHRYALISNIGASTRIENALLTDSEINWLDTVLTADGKITALTNNWQLIENKLSKERERSIGEVAGCRSMLIRIYLQAAELTPLRESDIRALHTELMRPYLKDSPLVGNYKTQPNSVIETNHDTKNARVVFKTADAGPVTKAAMADLVSWYNKIIKTELTTIPLAAELVYRFLAIHPFQDGNGRLGRGLFLLCLLQSNNQAARTVAQYLALDRWIEKNKEEYYFVLNACSNGVYLQNPAEYKMEYFLRFMIKIILAALDDFETYRNKFTAIQSLSSSATAVLECFKDFPEVRLNTKHLCEQTNLPRRTVIHSLNTLLKNRLIQKYGQGAGTRYQLVF